MAIDPTDSIRASGSTGSFVPVVVYPGREDHIGAEPSSPSSSTEPIRVLHVINGEHYSGAERVQDLLACRLPESGFHVDFACLKPDRFPEMRRAQQAEVIEMPMRTRYDFRVAFELLRRIKRGRYQLVHTHTPRTALMGGIAARAARVPWIYHVHSPTSRDTTHPWRNRVNAATEWISLLTASRLVTVSKSLAQHMKAQGFGSDQVVTVPNGVPCLPSTARQAPDQRWVLGTVALFRPRKGVEVLLDAMALLRQQKIDIRLHAVGGFETPEYEQQLKQHVKHLQLQDAVHWTGFRQDVNAELRQMDLFVLPSLFGEGLPMVVLEAMAVGIPVVATKVEGVPEAVRDGREGTLAAPGDPYDLAHAIRRIVQRQLDWNDLSACARERQTAVFSDRAMAAGVAEVYRGLLAQRRKN